MTIDALPSGSYKRLWWKLQPFRQYQRSNFHILLYCSTLSFINRKLKLIVDLWSLIIPLLKSKLQEEECNLRKRNSDEQSSRAYRLSLVLASTSISTLGVPEFIFIEEGNRIFLPKLKLFEGQHCAISDFRVSQTFISFCSCKCF